jgi:hypothetical protein
VGEAIESPIGKHPLMRKFSDIIAARTSSPLLRNADTLERQQPPARP